MIKLGDHSNIITKIIFIKQKKNISIITRFVMNLDIPPITIMANNIASIQQKTVMLSHVSCVKLNIS